MLRIISPNEHYHFRSRINIFLGLLGFYHNFSLHSEELAQSYFILAEEEDGHISGGAILYKKCVTDLENHIGSTLSDFIPPLDYVWACKVLFCPANSQKIPTQLIYENLFDALKWVVDTEDCDFLYFTLSHQEYRATLDKGSWFYMLEVMPNDSCDGQFHGIMSLHARVGSYRISSQSNAQRFPLAA